MGVWVFRPPPPAEGDDVECDGKGGRAEGGGAVGGAEVDGVNG